MAQVKRITRTAAKLAADPVTQSGPRACWSECEEPPIPLTAPWHELQRFWGGWTCHKLEQTVGLTPCELFFLTLSRFSANKQTTKQRARSSLGNNVFPAKCWNILRPRRPVWGCAPVLRGFFFWKAPDPRPPSHLPGNPGVSSTVEPGAASGPGIVRAEPAVAEKTSDHAQFRSTEGGLRCSINCG